MGRHHHPFHTCPSANTCLLGLSWAPTHFPLDLPALPSLGPELPMEVCVLLHRGGAAVCPPPSQGPCPVTSMSSQQTQLGGTVVSTLNSSTHLIVTKKQHVVTLIIISIWRSGDTDILNNKMFYRLFLKSVYMDLSFC